MLTNSILVQGNRSTLLMVSLLLLVSTRANGQPAPADVKHEFLWEPKGAQAGNIVPLVSIIHFEHAWGIEKSPNDARSQTNPPGQPGFFKAFGKDNISSVDGKVRQAGGGKVSMGSVPVPIAGTPVGGSLFPAEVTLLSGTHALGTTLAKVDPYGLGTSVTGTLEFHTEVQLGAANFNDGYAFSGGEISVTARHRDKKGRVRLGRTWHLGRGANAAWGRGKTRAVDPITWRVAEIGTGNIFEGSMAHIESTVENGTIDAVSGGYKVDAINGKLMMFIRSPHIAPEGSLLLVMEGGVVSRSIDSGVFDGVLPPVGTGSPFFLPMPALDFNYDLNGISNALIEADVTIEMGGDTEVEETNGGIDASIQVQGFKRPLDSLVGDFAKPFTVEVHLPGSPDPIFSEAVLPDALGDFHADFQEQGFFDVYVKGAISLRGVIRNAPLNIPSLPILNLPFTLRNGDCDNNNFVNTDDYLILNDAFDTIRHGEGFDPRADLDGNDLIGTDDYLLLSENFDLSGE